MAACLGVFWWSAPELREVEADIRTYTHHVAPTQTLDVIETDPSNNRILECAVAAKSDFIVSGDSRHMLPLGSYSGIQAVKLADFLALLE